MLLFPPNLQLTGLMTVCAVVVDFLMGTDRLMSRPGPLFFGPPFGVGDEIGKVSSTTDLQATSAHLTKAWDLFMAYLGPSLLGILNVSSPVVRVILHRFLAKIRRGGVMLASSDQAFLSVLIRLFCTSSFAPLPLVFEPSCSSLFRL